MAPTTDLADDGAIAVSNPGPDPLGIWLEPWCDELELLARTSVVFRPLPPAGTIGTAPMLAIDEGRLVVWASCPGALVLLIDGTVQDTGSATIALPTEMFAMPIKAVVEALFGDHPGARPGGREAARPTSPFRSLRKRLRAWATRG